MASGLAAVEQFLAEAGFERGPWVAVAFGAGIAAWFALPQRWEWVALIALNVALMLGALSLIDRHGRYPYLRLAIIAVCGALAAGCATVWAKSSIVGTPGIDRPLIGDFTGIILRREEQPADSRVRLTLATREPSSAGAATGRAIAVRLNVPMADDRPGLVEDATIRVKARLMPPAAPMVPGSYDFARTAWFAGLAGTGAALAPPQVIAPAKRVPLLAGVQRSLARHVHGQLSGSPGGIAAAFASGDQGGISQDDQNAMRNAGLTHLLSVSGLHLSAVVGATYAVVLGLLALWPWLALRVRLPIVAAGAAAVMGIAYTLLTGAEVPTVRSCLGALLVLLALALGREALSLRMLAVAAIAVMIVWPEAVVGPSFQLSFAAVLAIISLHSSAPARRFLARREEGWLARMLRELAMLLLTGLVIELALAPIGVFHFHRAGLYGAIANVVAIPLTTFVTMPLIGLALVLDVVGIGAPAWWLCGKSLELLLGIAHFVAARPGAVTRLPEMGGWIFAIYLAGALWLALWRGRVRLLGLVPIGFAVVGLALLRPPDLLISGDGQHVGVVLPASKQLVVLREGRGSYATDTLGELAGMNGTVVALADWPGARCTRDFCAIDLKRGDRTWHVLIGRSKDMVSERELSAACALADLVISNRGLPASCHPSWLKADRRLLDRTGGLALDLVKGRAASVAEHQGEQGWWRPRLRPGYFRPSSGSVGEGRRDGPEPGPHRDDKSAAHRPSWPDQAGPGRSRGGGT